MSESDQSPIFCDCVDHGDSSDVIPDVVPAKRRRGPGCRQRQAQQTEGPLLIVPVVAADVSKWKQDLSHGIGLDAFNKARSGRGLPAFTTQLEHPVGVIVGLVLIISWAFWLPREFVQDDAMLNLLRALCVKRHAHCTPVGVVEYPVVASCSFDPIDINDFHGLSSFVGVTFPDNVTGRQVDFDS